MTNGGIGAVNLTYTGSALLSHVAVLSGGSLVGGNGGPTAFTSMTSTTEVVEFYVAPPFSPTPVPSGNLSASRCRTVYTSSLICKPLPASPAVAANSAAWAALEFQSGHDNIGGITVSSDPTNPNEGSEPLDQLSPGGPSISTTVRCNKESYSAFTCKAAGVPDGTTITLPAGMYTQKGSDHHCAADIVTLGVEYDGWLCDDPVASPTLNVGGFGVCPWSGDGTGCSGSTATNIATSLGGIDPTELANAEADPIHGSLPYAIAASVLCGDPGFVKPAVSSDGANTNGSSACAGHTASGQRPPEGTRWFLALTDAQINATANLPYVKAILRTMDEQHFGGFISDTNWSGAPGLAVQYRHGSWPGPAAELGVNPNVTPTWTMPITTNGIDLSKVVTFCSNGSC